MRATTRVASSELPPKAKKSSSSPTSLAPRSPANTSATACSTGEPGARNATALLTCGAGSARRSSFPFGVNGRTSSTTIASGTM
ncbi:hypothetical protein NG2371_07185 [Nocardia gamkensis]|nr:hypothetical protein [Nocardia gamkensis]